MHPSAAVHVRPRSPSRAFAWIRTGDRALMAALIALHVAPLCLFPYFPSRDGPTHLEGALLLLRYHQPAGAALREWFTLALPLAPNWLDHVLLSALSLAVPPVVAEKALVAAFVIGLPLSARRAFAAVRPDAGFLAVLTFPFTYTWLLHMGFYNFCLGLPLLFLTAASWLHGRVASRAAVLRLTGWATLLYFTHPVALLAAATLLLTLAACSGVVDAAARRRAGHPRGDALRGACGRLARTALAFAPAAVLFGAWLLGRRHPAFARFPLRRLLRDLARLDVLVTFDPKEAWPAAALALLFAALAAAALASRLRQRRLLEGDGWLLATGAFLLAYLLAPHSLAGGAYLTPRLALLPFFGLLFWLASLRWSEAARFGVASAAAVICVAFLALHARSYGQANDLLREYLTAEPFLEPGTAVLPLHYGGPDPEGFPRVDVTAHAAAYLAVSRGTVDLVFYEGASQGIFPIAFRREVSPYHLLGDNPESVPPCVDLRGFTERTGRAIDAVLTWKRLRAREGDCAARTRRQLHEAYERVHVSRPRQLLEVWRLRTAAP